MTNKRLNESRTPGWKNSRALTLVKDNDGNKLVEYKDRYYSYKEICEMLRYTKNDIVSASSADIISLINEDYVDSEGMILNEVRYDWSKIDPRTGMPKVKEPRPEESIQLMNRMPGRSGWIMMFQNRVNLNSVGNMRYAKKVWFDRASGTVSTDENMEDSVHFRSYVLPGAGRPQGWMELADYERIKRGYR